MGIVEVYRMQVGGVQKQADIARSARNVWLREKAEKALDRGGRVRLQLAEE